MSRADEEVAGRNVAEQATVPIGQADAAGAASAPSYAQVGRFTVVGMVGAGGMGVVLEAHDPELHRPVAIKLVRPQASRDPGAAVGGLRLQREAQAMARLSHPNVVAVYDVGRIDGQTFIAMELVEGDTLRAWLRKDHPWHEVVDKLVAAGRGLAAAHEAGLVHRDFKPDNVLVGRDGRARVTDFGLVAGEARDAVGSPAMTSPHASLTVDGSLIGTPAYMSPEHWAGARIDARSDQFSFCVALWEALYGQSPFAGHDVATQRAALAAGRVRAPRDDRGVPRRIEAALRRGLAVDPAARWLDMPALLSALERAAARRRTPWLALAALVIAVASIAATLVVAREHRRARPRESSSPAPLPVDPATITRLTFADGCEELPALSPDGATVYYDATVGSDYHLFAVDAAGGAPRELTRTTGWDLAPTPSPDGTKLAFLRRQKAMSLYVADVDHLDQARPIADSALRPVWSPDGGHLWAGGRRQVARYDAATGEPGRTLVPPAEHVLLQGIELADGRFVALPHPLDASALADGLVLYAAEGGEPKWLYHGNLAEALMLLPDHDSVAVSAMNENRSIVLWRVPLDGAAPEPIVTGTIAARSRLDLAAGRLVWSDCAEHITIATFDTSAAAARLVDVVRNDWADWDPVASRVSGRYYFLSDRGGRFEIYRADRAHAGPVETLPLGGLDPVSFALTPDERLLVASVRDKGLFVAPTDGSSPPVRIQEAAGDVAPTIDREGRTIYFEGTQGGLPRLASIPVTGGKPSWVVEGVSRAPAASPAEDVLAYLVDVERATKETTPMLLDLSTGRTRALAAVPGASAVRWSPDGRRLLLVSVDQGIVEVEVASGRVTRHLESGGSQLMGADYVGDEILVGRETWAGDVWTARLTAPR